jgi:asparagine synthase (glutamine-hydrolysing)
MCGITGILSNNKEQSLTAIERMLQVQQHRGPDAQGFWQDDACTLGHNRLAIIDLDQAANQPMLSHNGRYVMVYNGEIYNYKEIKVELGLDPNGWKTQSDSEVLLEAFVHWGPACLHKLNGMFALAIWDTQNQELFIARDRLGIKPLYFAQQNNQFLFASELRTLLRSNLVDKSINLHSVHDFLRFQWIQTPNTIIKAIETLPAGSYAAVKNNQLDIHSWWDINAFAKASNTEDIEEVHKKVKALFYSAVEARMASDVPIGAFLSGGIDSSAVVAAMANSSANAINTFNIGFTEKKYNESEFAAAIAKKYNTQHQTLTYSAEAIKNDIPEILGSFDTPSADGVNSYVISKLVKEAGITVALSGLGGDELFCGYPVFKQLPSLQNKKWFWQIPRPVRQLAESTLSLTKEAKWQKLGRLLLADSAQSGDLYPYFREIYSEKTLKSILNTSINQSAFEAILKESNADQTLSWLSKTEITGYTQHVLLKDTDMCSMTHALEVRVPFFDYRLVEYVLALPDQYKIPLTPKKLLTDALGDDLPMDIINRPKMGFSFPWDIWIKNDLKSFVEMNLNKAANYPFLNSQAIQKTWQNYLKGSKSTKWYHIWNLVCLINWLEINCIE